MYITSAISATSSITIYYLSITTMVNWNDPAVEAKEYTSFKYFVHILIGAYLWEYVNYLGFDFQHLVKKDDHARWVKYVYLACRNFVLLLSILELSVFDFTDEGSCKLVSKMAIIALNISIALAALLITVRVIAIWKKDIRIIILVVIYLLAELGFLLFEMYECSGEWDLEADVCGFVNIQKGFPTAIAVTLNDSFLVFTMLLGLLCMRSARKNRIWNILWHQGLLWLVIVTIAEIPTVIVIHLNLNPVINATVVPPEVYIIAIGATRLYRSLHIIRREPNQSGILPTRPNRDLA